MQPDFKHLGNKRNVISFTIRSQRGSAGSNENWRVLEDVCINANLTDRQRLARGFALIRCARNQFKSTVHSNIYLLFMGEFTEPKTASPFQPFASLKNELSTHQQAIHPELWPGLGNLNTFVYVL